MNNLDGKFNLGQTVATKRIVETFDHGFITNILTRHLNGDYGDCGEDSIKMNNAAAKAGEGTILSVYNTKEGKVFIYTYVGDNTTIMFADEY